MNHVPTRSVRERLAAARARLAHLRLNGTRNEIKKANREVDDLVCEWRRVNRLLKQGTTGKKSKGK